MRKPSAPISSTATPPIAPVELAGRRPSAMLHNLKTVYTVRGLSPRVLSTLTNIPLKRIQLLANQRDRQEPWYDEALVLSRVLNTGRILPLMSATARTLADCTIGRPYENDMRCFRSGQRLPLTLACRVAVRLGLSDPVQLEATSIARQIWDVVEQNERDVAPGFCPWCLADVGTGHADTCLPALLYGERDGVIVSDAVLSPRPAGKGAQFAPAGRGFSVKALRDKMCLSQRGLATHVGVAPDTIARVERGDQRLTLKLAERIAAACNLAPEDLYKSPSDPANRITHPLSKPAPARLT